MTNLEEALNELAELNQIKELISQYREYGIHFCEHCPNNEKCSAKKDGYYCDSECAINLKSYFQKEEPIKM